MSDSLLERVVAALGDQYIIENEVGRGGMSVVYRARDARLNRVVAVKVLPPELAYDAAIRLRFTREAQTAAHLAHPHIVPIHDVGHREGVAYFVMTLIEGGSLATRIANDPRQPIDHACRMIAEIADALAYAHHRGVVHRDIKPDNILLDRETGRAMVSDFGIARAIEEGTRLTLTGVAVGTPTYMSPEQAMGEREVDGRSDIYSLGVVAYQMITGRVPFSSANSMSLLLKHVTEAPKAIADFRPDAPAFLRDAIQRALEKDPEDRWPTAAALRDAIRSGSPGARIANVNASDPARPGTRTAEPAAAVVRAGVVVEPAHLARFTVEERRDVRIWHGRVHVLDRIKAFRGYTVLTLGAIAGGLAAFVGGMAEGIPPAVLAPIVPIYMSRKWLFRARSLRAAGIRVRRALLMPRAKWALPADAREGPAASSRKKTAPTLPGLVEQVVDQAQRDRAAIIKLLATVPRADRDLLPDLQPTADALVDRVRQLADAVAELDRDVDPRSLAVFDERIAALEREPQSPELERRVALVRRQRTSIADLLARRATLMGQMESAALALGGLRLDLLKVRSSGLEAALSDISTATQEARALSQEIASALSAAAELRRL